MILETSYLERATGLFLVVWSYSFTVVTPKTIPILNKQTSKWTKCVLIYLHCQPKWKLPGCGFNWKWNPSLAVQIYYCYTSPSVFHLGNKPLRWWMRQYLYIICKVSKDVQFKSTIRLLLQSSNEDSDFGEKNYIQLNTKNNFLNCDFCISCTDQSIPFNLGGRCHS